MPVRLDSTDQIYIAIIKDTYRIPSKNSAIRFALKAVAQPLIDSKFGKQTKKPNVRDIKPFKSISKDHLKPVKKLTRGA